MVTVELSVPDAHCGACRGAIVTTLQARAGVRHVEVDLRDRHVTVLFHPAAIDVGELCRVLAAAGFPARPLAGPSA